MFHRIRVFHERYPLVGPTFWIVSLQYFITQTLVAKAWPTNYSWLNNVISDLGNTVCGDYVDRYVCSPYASWMNASFVVLGATMIAGSSLIYQSFRRSTGSALGFSFMALAGFGTMLVGFFPENTVAPLHALGALLPFLLGNMGLVILGLALNIPRSSRIYTLLSGLIALAALGLFYTQNYLGIGAGGMERLVAYPQTVWLIVFGIYISEHRYQKAVRRSK